MRESEQKQSEQKNAEQEKSKLSLLEGEAATLKSQGNILAGLEKLEQAIAIDAKWYHFRCKAEWNLEINQPDKAQAAIDDGLKLDNSLEQLFWLLSWKANFLLRSRLNPNEAMRYLLQAENILYNQSPYVHAHMALFEVPDALKWINPVITSENDIKTILVSLRSEIQSANYMVTLFTQIKDVERKIDSERVRTIELLGIFTAVFAFIFSGVQILTRLPLSEALVLQVGIGLVLIIFFLGLHLVIERQSRTKGLIALLIFLVIFLLALPFYARFLRNTFANEANVVPTVSQENVRPVNEK